MFIKVRSIPGDEYASTIEICTAAEVVCGRDTILGAQRIRGLWRIYPQTDEARQTLIVEGITLRGVRLEVCRSNPYAVRDDGNERPYTKVWVGDVPISVADSEIENALCRIGCELRSGIRREQARKADGGLTRWLTGRRSILITLPPQPLEKSLDVLTFTASLYHKEQRDQNRPRHCNRCLQEGHISRECQNDVVCHACQQPGHRRGDPLCEAVDQADNPDAGALALPPLLPPPPASTTPVNNSPTVIPNSQPTQQPSQPTQQPTLSQPATPEGAMGPPLPSQPNSQSRGRSKKKDSSTQRKTRDRSISLRNAYDIFSRARSQSTKRNATEMDVSDNTDHNTNSKKKKEDNDVELDTSTDLDMDDGWN